MGTALVTAPSGTLECQHCHPCVTTAQLPPRPGFADPRKSIAAVCQWPARGEGTRGDTGAEAERDGEGAGGPQGHGERLQNNVVGEGLDGGDPEAFVSCPGGSGGSPLRMQPSSCCRSHTEPTETLPNADHLLTLWGRGRRERGRSVGKELQLAASRPYFILWNRSQTSRQRARAGAGEHLAQHRAPGLPRAFLLTSRKSTRAHQCPPSSSTGLSSTWGWEKGNRGGSLPSSCWDHGKAQ